MIKAIIFDCFGVLFRDKVSMLYDVVPKAKHPIMHDIIRASDHGMLTRREYYQQIAELAAITPEEIETMSKRQYSRNEELFAKLHELKPRYKLGLLSNISDHVVEDIFTHEERTQLFDAFVQSWRYGITKPAREIYEIAADQLHTPAIECLMIDDLPVNVEGAEMAGMQAWQFTNNQQLFTELDRLMADSHV